MNLYKGDILPPKEIEYRTGRGDKENEDAGYE